MVARGLDLAATPAVQVGAFMAGRQDKADSIFVACEPGDLRPMLAGIREVRWPGRGARGDRRHAWIPRGKRHHRPRACQQTHSAMTGHPRKTSYN